MSCRPKHVYAVTPPAHRDTLLEEAARRQREEEAKRRSQIANARARASRFADRATATGVLTASERQQLDRILSSLAGATSPTSATAARAAGEMRQAYRIAEETEGRASELAQIDRTGTQDLAQLADAELRRQGKSQMARLPGLGDRLAAGKVTSADAQTERRAVEAALAQLFFAQSQLHLFDVYVADLSRLGIACTVEHQAAQQAIRRDPARTDAVRREFESLLKTRIGEWARLRKEKEGEEVVARYAQLHTLRTRLGECRSEAETAMREGQAAAPDAAQRVEDSPQGLSAAIGDLEARWAPGEVEPAFAELDAALAALRDAVKARRGIRRDVERAAGPHQEALRERLDALDTDSAEAQRIDGAIARLPGLANAAAVESEVRRLEAEIDKLAAAAARPAPDIAQNGVIAALTRLGGDDAHAVDWEDPDFRALREARLGEPFYVFGRFRKDGSSIVLAISLSHDADAGDDAAGVKVAIECHDGEGLSCDLVKKLPRALYETRAFVEATGEAAGEWKEVHNTQTEQAGQAPASEAARRQERTRTI